MAKLEEQRSVLGSRITLYQAHLKSVLASIPGTTQSAAPECRSESAQSSWFWDVTIHTFRHKANRLCVLPIIFVFHQFCMAFSITGSYSERQPL